MKSHHTFLRSLFNEVLCDSHRKLRVTGLDRQQ
jgi:hypothetical protein